MYGNIVIISGPSGCGKSSLISEILKEEKNIYFSLSSTTRNIREGEKEGVNYFYISKEQFEEEIKEGLFLEWAQVHGNYYGTSLKPIYQALQEKKLVILDIDVQGHEIVKKKFEKILTSVFVTTHTKKELQNRLIHRGTDNESTIQTRLKNAQIEMNRMDEYDYLVINDDFHTALSQLHSIIKAARLKPSQEDIKQFIAKW